LRLLVAISPLVGLHKQVPYPFVFVGAVCRLVFVSEKKGKKRGYARRSPIGVCGVVGIGMLQALRKLRLLFH
jgi:hypothetical protein